MSHYNAYWDFNDSTTLRLRIGTGGPGHFAFQGNTFPTWTDWKNFLTHNAHRLIIKNTANKIVSVDEFIAMIESVEPYHLREWYEEEPRRMKKVDNETRAKGRVWWDEQGFFFRNEDF